MVEANEPLATSTGYEYDPAGNLTEVTDPRGNSTSFSYDELGRMTAINQPLSKTTIFGYDPVGNLTSRTTAEDTLTLTYDAADRLAEISEGTNTLRAFGYDTADRLTEATDAQAKTLEIGYDDDDRVISLDDDRGQTVSRSFDSRGNLSSQTDGRGTLTYAYDELGRMTQLTDPQSQLFEFGYDPEGNLTTTELPNGVTTMNSYDDAGRMASTASTNGATVLQSFGYAYDAAGNRTSQTDRLDEETTYEYDALSRLTEWDPPNDPAVAYAYDAAGNRTEADGVTSGFNALNQLTSSSDGMSYDYDGAGRLVEETDGSQTATYEWNALDQLTEVDRSSTVSYSYDALGRRSERTQGSTTETTHYGDLTDLAILDTNPATVAQSYVQGTAGLLEERSGSQSAFPLADAHGDLVTGADASGAVIARQAYDPWGEQLSGSAQSFGWLGAQQRRTDVAAETVQMGIRPYRALPGRFLSEDLVLGYSGRTQTGNRYGYALSDPINRYDLSGLFVPFSFPALPISLPFPLGSDSPDPPVPSTASQSPTPLAAGNSSGSDRHSSQSPSEGVERRPDPLKSLEFSCSMLLASASAGENTDTGEHIYDVGLDIPVPRAPSRGVRGPLPGFGCSGTVNTGEIDGGGLGVTACFIGCLGLSTDTGLRIGAGVGVQVETDAIENLIRR
jgi:RHS repeat-associated protein